MYLNKTEEDYKEVQTSSLHQNTVLFHMFLGELVSVSILGPPYWILNALAL